MRTNRWCRNAKKYFEKTKEEHTDDKDKKGKSEKQDPSTDSKADPKSKATKAKAKASPKNPSETPVDEVAPAPKRPRKTK